MALERLAEESILRAQGRVERTGQIKAKRRRGTQIRLGVAELGRRWPELFTTPRPLALGTGQRISAQWPEMPWAELIHVLRFWTNSPSYLQVVAAGMERRNLDGSPGGVPTEEQQAFARETLRRRGKWPVKGVLEAAEAPAAYG